MSLQKLEHSRLVCTQYVYSTVFSRGFQTNWGADGKILPHGGAIKENMATEAEAKDILSRCDETINLNARQLCDVELLMNGGYVKPQAKH